MTDEELLLAAVIASPKDDLPRLVYADLLDETGRPLNIARAEFIRVQCELNRGVLDRERLADLLIREKTLLSLHGPAWLEPLRRKGEPLFSARSHGLFRRGFVEVVWMPAGWFLWKSELLFRRAPVTEVRITLSTLTEFAELMRCESLLKLEVLDFSDRRLGNAAIAEVLRSPYLGNLKTLRLRACNLSETSAEWLALTETDWNLDELDLSLNPLSEGAVEGLRKRFGDVLVRARTE